MLRPVVHPIIATRIEISSFILCLDFDKIVLRELVYLFQRSCEFLESDGLLKI